MRMQNTEKSTRAQEHKSTRPWVLTCALVTCALATFWGGEIAADQAGPASLRCAGASGPGFANATQGELLRDDYVISGLDGKLSVERDGRRLFEFETDVSDGRATLKAGEPLELLESATLEKMIEDAAQRKDTRYRLWGKITKFKGRNYIFASYFLPLRKADKPEDANGTTKQTVNSPNDVLKIPDEIMARLQTSEVLPTGETPAKTQLKQDVIFANRLGFVVEKNAGFEFVPDGLGRSIGKFTIELLPCQSLERALEEMQSEPNPVRFNVAGILTRYKDKRYLLLQKVTRAYSYGNFGK
jgi:hypothetical protein